MRSGSSISSTRLHEHVHPLEGHELVFDVGGVEAEHRRHDRRVELVALHARHGEQAPVALTELLDLSLDHAAHGLRQLAHDVRNGTRESPVAVHLGNHA